MLQMEATAEEGKKDQGIGLVCAFVVIYDFSLTSSLSVKFILIERVNGRRSTKRQQRIISLCPQSVPHDDDDATHPFFLETKREISHQ